MLSRKYLYLALLAISPIFLRAQSGKQSVKSPAVKNKSTVALPAYRPTRDEMLERYRKASVLDSVARNKVFKTSVQANWQADGESFWYRNSLKDTVLEYYYVDAARAQKRKAFDHARLAQAVGMAAGKTYDPLRLRISNMIFENNATVIVFQLDGRWWKCGLNSYECTPASAPAGIRDPEERRC